MEADRQAIRQFLERVHGGEPAGWLIIWTRQDKATRAFAMGAEGALDQAWGFLPQPPAQGQIALRQRAAIQAIALPARRLDAGEGHGDTPRDLDMAPVDREHQAWRGVDLRLRNIGHTQVLTVQLDTPTGQRVVPLEMATGVGAVGTCLRSSGHGSFRRVSRRAPRVRL